MKTRTLLIGLILIIAGSRADAQGPFDLLPQDASASIAIRNLDELMKKGDEFLEQSEIKLPIRPSLLFNEANKYLEIQKGLNKNGSAAIFFMMPAKGARASLGDLETLLVPAVPFIDADEMAGNFGIAKGTLKPKTIVRTTKSSVKKYATRTQKHVYLSASEDTLLRLQASKFVASTVSPAHRKLFNESDILLHFGRHLWQTEGEQLRSSIADRLKTSDDPKEKEFALHLTESLKEVQDAVLGFRIEDGLEANFLATFPKDKQAAKLIASLRDHRKASTLAGLPEGNVLLAQASAGDARRQAMLAKALFRFMLEDLLVNQKIIADLDRLNYLGIFQEVWRQLDGNRFAVYQNADEKKLGLFSAIAILDTENPAEFLRQMRILSKMADADSLDLSRKEIKEEIDIERLVRDLGSSVYVVRQSANVKLALIGEPALPYLQKYIDLNTLNLETRRRSQTLRDRITGLAAARRKELLSGKDEPLFVRPKLTYVANVEKREGRNIDAVNVKIAGLEKVPAHQYSQLLGPDWDKIRIAVVGKQIVVLLGSDLSLFDAALRNVEKGHTGLATTKRLAGHAQRSAKDRLFEMHVSVEGILRLVSPKVPRDTPLALTSIALSFGEQSIHMNSRVPISEVRAIGRKAQESTQP